MSEPETIRYVTRTGLFAEIIAPDPGHLDRAREGLEQMTDDDRYQAVARYMAARLARKYSGLCRRGGSR